MKAQPFGYLELRNFIETWDGRYSCDLDDRIFAAREVNCWPLLEWQMSLLNDSRGGHHYSSDMGAVMDLLKEFFHTWDSTQDHPFKVDLNFDCGQWTARVGLSADQCGKLTRGSLNAGISESASDKNPNVAVLHAATKLKCILLETAPRAEVDGFPDPL